MFSTVISIRRKKSSRVKSKPMCTVTKQHKTLDHIATHVLESVFKTIWIGSSHVIFGCTKEASPAIEASSEKDNFSSVPCELQFRHQPPVFHQWSYKHNITVSPSFNFQGSGLRSPLTEGLYDFMSLIVFVESYFNLGLKLYIIGYVNIPFAVGWYSFHLLVEARLMLVMPSRSHRSVDCLP